MRFDPKPYQNRLDWLRRTHGRELTDKGWDKATLFRGVDLAAATTEQEVPKLLSFLRFGGEILAIDYAWIMLDWGAPGLERFRKNGRDLFEWWICDKEEPDGGRLVKLVAKSGKILNKDTLFPIDFYAIGN